MNYFVSPSGLIKKVFNGSVWDSKQKKILLTFDDSPTEGVTEMILEKLKKENIRGVFFCVGKKANDSPDLIREIIREGHTIGNHSFSHQSLFLNLSRRKLEDEIITVNKLFAEKFDYNIKLFRPPYGRFNFLLLPILRRENMINVMWSVLTLDYKNNINLVKFTVQKYLINNSIVVLHDNIKSKEIIIQAIDKVINEAKNRGYEIGDPAECLR
ncbi:MAG: polysaccharide deacetylase family protein [Ignavibacteriaceae bacterium]